MICASCSSRNVKIHPFMVGFLLCSACHHIQPGQLEAPAPAPEAPKTPACDYLADQVAALRDTLGKLAGDASAEQAAGHPVHSEIAGLLLELQSVGGILRGAPDQAAPPAPAPPPVEIAPIPAVPPTETRSPRAFSDAMLARLESIDTRMASVEAETKETNSILVDAANNLLKVVRSIEESMNLAVVAYASTLPKPAPKPAEQPPAVQETPAPDQAAPPAPTPAPPPVELPEENKG